MLDAVSLILKSQNGNRIFLLLFRFDFQHQYCGVDCDVDCGVGFDVDCDVDCDVVGFDECMNVQGRSGDAGKGNEFEDPRGEGSGYEKPPPEVRDNPKYHISPSVRVRRQGLVGA